MAAGWWSLGENLLMDQRERLVVIKPNSYISCMKFCDFILVLECFLIVVYIFYFLFVLKHKYVSVLTKATKITSRNYAPFYLLRHSSDVLQKTDTIQKFFNHFILSL